MVANGEPHPRSDDFGLSGMTLGLTVDEHHDDCPNVDHESGTWLGVGDCPGCRSPLGGARYAATIWF